MADREDSAERHTDTSTGRATGGDGTTPGVGDLRALMRDTLWDILPELLAERTPREGRYEEPLPSGKTWPVDQQPLCIGLSN